MDLVRSGLQNLSTRLVSQLDIRHSSSPHTGFDEDPFGTFILLLFRHQQSYAIIVFGAQPSLLYKLSKMSMIKALSPVAKAIRLLLDHLNSLQRKDSTALTKGS